MINDGYENYSNDSTNIYNMKRCNVGKDYIVVGVKH